jgi:hypothetical protein
VTDRRPVATSEPEGPGCPGTEALSRFADGDAGPAEAGSITEHLVSCAGCREELAGLRSMTEGLRALGPVAPPPDLLPRAIEAAGARRRKVVAWAGGAAVCAALLAVVLSVALPRRTTGPHRTPERNLTLLQRAEEEFDTAERHYQTAVTLLRRLAEREKPLWPATRQRDFDADLRALGDAIALARIASERAPGDPVVRNCLYTAYRTEIEYLRDVLTPSDFSR